MTVFLYGLLIFLVLAVNFFPVAPARAQATEILKPTAHTYSGKAEGNIDPVSAYDTTACGDETTANTLGVGLNNTDRTIEYHTWQTPTRAHTARRLYVRRSGSGNIDDNWGIYYSTNGGASYTAIETGLINPADGNTPVVTIDTELDLSNLQVKIATAKVDDDDTGVAHIWDVWLEGGVTPCISITPDKYDFGLVSEGAAVETTLTCFTITNNSASPINITISGTDATGGATWILSDDATPGANTYGLKAGLKGGDYTIIVRKNGPYNTLVSDLGASANQSWGFKLYAPTTMNDGVPKTGTITLTATAA